MKAKQRGLHRKCEGMVRHISERTEMFPQPHQGSGYWHLHLPVAPAFLDSMSSPFGVRRLCVQTLLNRARHLSSIAPVNGELSRVVVAVSLPQLRDSQIIVFFGADYFDTFFDRDTEAQRWTQIGESRSLVREWDLQLPDSFSEFGYREEIKEPGFQHTGEIWFIGQLAAG